MTVAIAAAGTGGHVYPGLAVAEVLDGLPVLFVGGDRFEATAVPAAGYRFVAVELQGLERSLTPRNLTIPFVVRRAAADLASAFRDADVRALLATGGYVTVPAALAARRLGIPYFLHEQNARAGLANRLMGRRAVVTYTSFAETAGAVKPRFVGNPVRRDIALLDRPARHRPAAERYDLDPTRPIVGVVGGSLGSGHINRAMVASADRWAARGVQVLHIAGRRFAEEVSASVAGLSVTWRVVGFEEHMEDFLAASDLVVSRASGMVAELTATGTPAILVPGSYGSSGHQDANAAILAAAGAALVVAEADMHTTLGSAIVALLDDPSRLATMSAAAAAIGRPDAARVIAEDLRDAAS